MYHMRVISKKRLREFWEDHADAELPLTEWYKTARKADWSSINDVRDLFPHADGVEVESGRVVTVFNVKGNAYRLVVDILYDLHLIYVCEVMTHAEYNKEKWKGHL